MWVRALQCAFALVLTYYCTEANSQTINPTLIPFKFHGRGDIAAASQLVTRVLGEQATNHFELRIIGDCPEPYQDSSSLCFVLEDTDDGRVKVSGTSVSEVTYGIFHYLRFYCNMDVSWERTGGRQVHIPSEWPRVNEVFVKVRSSPISYFNNVVTFSYSFVWYSWSDWERFIDWAALFGYNVMIAYTGQEEIYRRTFNSFGVSDDEFSEWCNGPAYLAWGRGQNLHGMSSPLPLKWMKEQEQLQVKILERTRSLGIVPVLPTFQGNLPPQFRTLFPDADITKKGTAWLDGTDPLFPVIQERYMREMIKAWGTDHWYETDGYFDKKDGPWQSSTRGSDDQQDSAATFFDENRGTGSNSNPIKDTIVNNNQADTNTKPENSFAGLHEIPVDAAAQRRSRLVFESMSKVDPDAIWLYQGWIWRGFGEDQLSYMKGWISGVPKGRFVMLNMWDEVEPEWQRFDGFSYFGAPFIWSVLHNFGGNTGLWGSLQTLNSEPFNAMRLQSTSMVGVGAAPEGIDQNPVYYSFLSDINWTQKPLCLKCYISDFALRRYKLSNPSSSKERLAGRMVRQAWFLLLESVYSESANRARIAQIGGFQAEKNSDGMTSIPLSTAFFKPPTQSWYKKSMVVKAWEAMAKAGSLLPNTLTASDTFTYDLVNIGREVLAQYSTDLFHKLLKSNCTEDVEMYGSALQQLMQHCDQLLCSSPSMSTDTWLAMARKLAHGDEKLADYYEINARSQTTTWGPQKKDSPVGSMNLDYANKQWGGQIGGFYLLRIQCFIDQALKDFSSGASSVDEKVIADCVGRVSYEWTHDVGAKRYPICDKRSTTTLLTQTLQLLSKYQSHRFSGIVSSKPSRGSTVAL